MSKTAKKCIDFGQVLFETWTLTESSGVSCISCKYECLPSEKFQVAEISGHFLYFAGLGCFWDSAVLGRATLAYSGNVVAKRLADYRPEQGEFGDDR